MRTPSPSWCGLDRTHLWPTGSSLGDPLITARNFSSCPSDSISRWTPCPPETESGGFRSALAVFDFRLRAGLDVFIPSTSPARVVFNTAFGYSAPHPSTGGTSTLLINALLSAHHGSIRGSGPKAFSGYPRGHRGYTETGCPQAPCRLQAILILTLEPERLRTDWPPPEKIAGDGRGSSPETLKRLAILVFRRRSSLPSSTESA